MYLHREELRGTIIELFGRPNGDEEEEEAEIGEEED
jgi:hypothetical protein